MKNYIFAFGMAVAVLISGCGVPGKTASDAALMEMEIAVFPEVEHQILDVDVDFEQEKLFVDCALTIRNPAQNPAPILPLNLYRLLDVKSVKDDGGRPVPYVQRVLIFEDWEKFQANHVRIALDPPLVAGESRVVHLEYDGHLLGYTEAMGYVKDHIDEDYTLIRSDSYVFPSIGINSWAENRKLGLGSFHYQISVTVPEGLLVAGPGKLLSKEPVGDRIKYSYQSLVPGWRIDVAVAVFEVLEDPGNGLKFFVLPEDKAGGLQLMAAMKSTMELYTEWFGPLRVFEGITVLEVPEGYGSQASSAAIIQQASGFRDKDNYFEFYHELSHLWDVEARDPLPPRFVSEGMGMFLQHLVQEKLEGKENALAEAVRVSLQRMEKYFNENPEAADIPMIDYGKEQMTDLSYRMGQILYYLLYDMMGEEKFLRTFGGFYQDNTEKGATVRQFVDYYMDAAGVDLDRVFEEWVFTPRAAEILKSGITLPELLGRYR